MAVGQVRPFHLSEIGSHSIPGQESLRLYTRRAESPYKFTLVDTIIGLSCFSSSPNNKAKRLFGLSEVTAAGREVLRRPEDSSRVRLTRELLRAIERERREKRLGPVPHLESDKLSRYSSSSSSSSLSPFCCCCCFVCCASPSCGSVSISPISIYLYFFFLFFLSEILPSALSCGAGPILQLLFGIEPTMLLGLARLFLNGSWKRARAHALKRGS